MGAFLASVRKLCSRDSALWRVNTSSSSPGAGANPCLERYNREFGLYLVVICSSSISLRSHWARKAPLSYWPEFTGGTGRETVLEAFTSTLSTFVGS